MIELMIFLIQIIELIIKFNLYYTLDDICLPGAIRELCEARDSGVVQFVDCEQYCWVCFILAFPVLMYSGGKKNPDLPIKSTENLNMTCRHCVRLVTTPTDVVLCLYSQLYEIVLRIYIY